MCSTPPFLLNYFYIPVIAVTVLLGFFVFYNNYKKITNRLFFIFSIVIALWMLFNMLNFSSTDFDSVLLYDRLSVIGIFIPAIFFIFIYFFSDDLENKFTMTRIKTFLFLLPILPFILFSATKYNIQGLTPPPECETIVGPFYELFIAVTVFYIAGSLIVFYKKFRMKNTEAKKQIKIIFCGFGFSAAWVLMTNVVLQIFGFPNASLFAPIGSLLLIISIAYAIVEYQFLNVKLIATQAMVVALVILIASQFAFIRNDTNKILTAITLFIAMVFGWILVHSVKKEVKQKEELEIANKEINERKEQLQKMADFLAIANDKLKVLDSAKTEFISMASHQLRTPVTGIKGYLSMLIEGSYGTINPEQKIALQKTFDSNERMVNLIEDLLNVSRIESGRLEYEFSNVKIEDLCREVVDTLYPKAKNLGLYLDYKKSNIDFPELWIDGGKVREVISNLLDNAIKYTPRGGVSLLVGLCDKNELSCLFGKHIRITVSDTGIGVPKEEMPYLFEKFSRGKDINRLNTGGTGLGLFVGRKMIEGNGGKVWVESEGKDKGSRFIIELPMQ